MKIYSTVPTVQYRTEARLLWARTRASRKEIKTERKCCEKRYN